MSGPGDKDPRPDDPQAVPPGDASLAALASAAAGCQACDLWRLGTQTVFGRGRARAPSLMLDGEQPGDVEDREGEPFVGPAGRLLDRGLEEAGIDRSSPDLTNVVKHFKWRPSGGGARRIHDKPNWTQIGACLPWLEAEAAAVTPELTVCPGATAAQAVIGSSFRVPESAAAWSTRSSGSRAGDRPPVLDPPRSRCTAAQRGARGPRRRSPRGSRGDPRVSRQTTVGGFRAGPDGAGAP